MITLTYLPIVSIKSLYIILLNYNTFKEMKLRFLLIALLISLCTSNETKDKVSNDKANSLVNDCDNPCATCQRTIYQLKFHQIATCGEGHCRNTCYKVKELWGTDDGVFKPFQTDIFGKCEICFRANFCSIAECKVQQEKEAEIIDRIVNASKLTGKKEDIISHIGFEQFNNEKKITTEEELDALSNKFVSLKNDINSKLDIAFGNEVAVTEVAGQVQTIIDKSFTKETTFTSEGIKKIVDQKPNEERVKQQLKESSKKLKESFEALAKNEKVDKKTKKENFDKLKTLIQENEELITKAKEKKSPQAKIIEKVNNQFKEVMKLIEAPEKETEEKVEKKDKKSKKRRHH